VASSVFASPLRYPGGKAGFTTLLTEIIQRNGLGGCTYAEPFAGGAGAALSLLYGEHVSRILINDLDPQLGAFWRSILDNTNEFLKLLWRTEPTVDEWYRQRTIYQNPGRHSKVRVGFATFFLNRCNRSGIIANGGPIGGLEQTGKWGIGARWNPEGLEKRIRRIAAYRERIDFFQMDARKFLSDEVLPRSRDAMFVYLDPPYYKKGFQLYLNASSHADHENLARYLKRIRRFKWVASYDNAPEIAAMYKGLRRKKFDLTYTARERSVGNEILIHQPDLDVPTKLSQWIIGRSAT
jgi:DNA adenine methylase